MQIQVLGCSGGIGQDLRTTSLLFDDCVLIDMGTGVGDLSLDAMEAIDTVFLTHSHLDHIATLPLMLDSVGPRRHKPLQVYALRETIETLQTHIFNGSIWPDFTSIPTAEAPFLRLDPIAPGQSIAADNKNFQAITVNHTVPAVGYLVGSDAGSFAFTGDTAQNEEFWDVINGCDDLKHLIIETSFVDADAEVASLSRHLSPAIFVEEMAKYRNNAKVWLTHMMPGFEEEIAAQIRQHNSALDFSILKRGDRITFK